jgi:hypothetical protein
VRARAFAAVAAATAIVALFPAAAGAHGKPAGRHAEPASHVHRTKSSVSDEMQLRGTNGFAIKVTLDNRSRLTVSVEPRGGTGIAFTSYTLKAPQRPGSDTIKASLGKLGRIDMRFVGDSKKEEAPPEFCTGGKTRSERGHWVGHFVFRGEQGYTQVDARRASGTVDTQPRLICHPGKLKGELKKILREIEKELKELENEIGPEESAEIEELEGEIHSVEVKVRVKHELIAFAASRGSAPDGKGKETALTNFVAVAKRHRGRIEESSVVLQLLEPGRTFTVPDITHLTHEGVVKPPPPFSGSATYRRESPHSLTWTGDLSVDLPGFGDIPLAGRRTTATVCADDGCHG